MKNEKSIAWGKGSLVLSVLLLSLAYLSPAFGSSSGITTNCNGCHSVDEATLTISGAETVVQHSEATYTLTISGGPAIIGGLWVSAEGGTLGLSDAATKFMGDDIVQTTPKDFSGSTVSWDFTWTAPAFNGSDDSYDLVGWGVSANDQAGNGGDWWATSTFSVQVIPIPGAAVLFGSALGILGWLRRRVT